MLYGFLKYFPTFKISELLSVLFRLEEEFKDLLFKTIEISFLIACTTVIDDKSCYGNVK